MFESFIRLAVSKSACEAETAALAPVLAAAIALDQEERTFGERIAANKALRGEGPTKLSKKKRADVDSYASDADELEAQQLLEFSEFERSAQIIACLAPGLKTDIAFWEKSYKMAHPSDVPLVQALVAKKAGLSQAMGSYLSAHGHEDG